MQLWSHAFIDNDSDTMTCTVDEKVWNRIQSEVQGQRLFAEIQFGEQSVICALGSPVRISDRLVDDDLQSLFVPFWALERLGAEGMGEIVDVKWRSEEAFPEATRIVLRPHDSAFYHGDAKAELEAALTRLGILRAGDTVTVPLTVLGGFEIGFDVVVTEPANIVLMQGDEVAIEFEEARDGAAEAQAPVPRPATPVASSPLEGDFLQGLEAFPAAAAAPPPSLFPGEGQALGGASRRMPDGRPWNPWRV
jgi:hypothetical protein